VVAIDGFSLLTHIQNMAKELPYFKFEPAEYLTKDISFCSLSAQGLFVNICCYYWQRGCSLTKEQLLRRLNYENELSELVSEGVIDLIENDISIKFLDNQLNEVEKTSVKNKVNGSKGGRPKKNPNETQTKPTLNPSDNPNETQTKGIREDKIREEEKKENKKDPPLAFSFFDSLIFLGAKKELVSDWIKVRKTKKLTNTETALKNFKSELLKSGKDINFVLDKCVVNSWGGFNSDWIKDEKPKTVITYASPIL